MFDYFHKAGQVNETFVKALKEGKIRLGDESETVVSGGFDKVPEIWMKLFEGYNVGKLITKVE